jgi:hypothetical protein
VRFKRGTKLVPFGFSAKGNVVIFEIEDLLDTALHRYEKQTRLLNSNQKNYPLKINQSI